MNEPKRGLLLVDHGSRSTEANAVLEGIADQVRTRDRHALVRVAHMELAPPTIADALADLVACGVDEVIVYPHFLAPGQHIRGDIPALLKRAASSHPALRLCLAEPLGTHPGLVDVILERIAGAKPLVDDPPAEAP